MGWKNYALCATVILLFPLACVHAQGTLNFTGRNLTDSNFTVYPPGALVGANFTNAILNGAQFQNVNLTNANFTGAQMRRSAIAPTNLSGANLDHTCFQKARLDSANLQYATFRATNFSKASLYAADFGVIMTIKPSNDSIRTRFDSTKLDFEHFPISRWRPAYWSYTDLSYTQIIGMSSHNFSFRNKDISRAILRGGNFMSYDFGHCTMTNTDLSGAWLNYANLDSAVMDGVKLVKTKLNHAQLVKARLWNPSSSGRSSDLSGATLNNATLTGCNFSNAVMHGTTLLSVTADSCSFNNANLESDSVGNYNVANLAGAHLYGASFNSAQLNGVNFSNAYLAGAQFSGITMLNTVFMGAVMPLCNFEHCNLEGVLFTGAQLQMADFKSTTIKALPGGGAGVDFSCTQLGGADFSNAVVMQASFSDAVMVVTDSCCTSSTHEVTCGLIPANQLIYGPTVLPKLSSSVTCPNGDNGICSGSQWVVPHWRSANCNSAHLTQTLWYKPNCGGADTSGEINFPDPNLKSCIMKQISGGKPGYVITKNAVAQVSALNCSNSNVSNLEGLQNFISLSKLDVSTNNITDISVIGALPLNTLDVSHNKIADLDLENMPNLVMLTADNNLIRSIVLNANVNLTYLDVSYNQLTTQDISWITTLNYVDMSHNMLTSVGDDLSSLSNVNIVYLQNNSLATIGNMSQLYNDGNGSLHYLNVSCNFPFQCNTLGLDSTSAERDFLAHAQCGENSLPGCNPPVHTRSSHKK